MKKRYNLTTKIYYVWFHHMTLSPATRQRIQNVIMKHNYKEFMQLRQLLVIRDEPDIEFLPQYGYTISEDGSEEQIVDITKKENFFKIRVCDCECG